MFYKLLFFIVLIFFCNLTHSQDVYLNIAGTTSTHDTGFMQYINKKFEEKYDYKVLSISLATQQAIETAKKGNIDILLVHHKPSEEKFVNDGFGIKRYNLMFNDFVFVGPKKIFNNKVFENIKELLNFIENKKIKFISRGDGSGTHKKEILIWKKYDFKINKFGNWYMSVGQGMGSVLNIANTIEAVTITDRGSWLNSKNKKNLNIIFENNELLFNQYGIIAVKKDNYNQVAQKYINWILSEEGKDLINNFKIMDKQIFFYNFK